MWVVRIPMIVLDDRSVAFKVVHTVLGAHLDRLWPRSVWRSTQRDVGAGPTNPVPRCRRANLTAAMGQPVTVIEKKSATPGVVRFEINRSISGMGIERYPSRGTRPSARSRPAELARRLFDHGGVAGVTINSNMITVDLEPGGSTAGMKEMIEELFLYYREGVEVVVPEGFGD